MNHIVNLKILTLFKKKNIFKNNIHRNCVFVIHWKILFLGNTAKKNILYGINSSKIALKI